MDQIEVYLGLDRDEISVRQFELGCEYLDSLTDPDVEAFRYSESWWTWWRLIWMRRNEVQWQRCLGIQDDPNSVTRDYSVIHSLEFIQGKFMTHSMLRDKARREFKRGAVHG